MLRLCWVSLVVLVAAPAGGLAFQTAGRLPPMPQPLAPLAPLATCASSSALDVHRACVAKPSKAVGRARPVRMLGGGGFGGGFLNMGTPELVVIGAVAWVVLGPKELFRLSKEAGKFIGEWQQLGMNAKNQFTEALDKELAEDQLAQATQGFNKAKESFQEGLSAGASGLKEGFEAGEAAGAPSWARDAGMGAASFKEGMKEGAEKKATPPVTEWGADAMVEPVGGSSSSSVEEMQAIKRQAAEEAEQKFSLTPEEEEKIRENMYAEMGRPEENAANFADQISGARNAAVMAEYPDTLSAPDDGSPLDLQSADEMLLENQIAEQINALETLKAEKQVLALKRQQLEQNAARAQKMAEERDELENELMRETDERMEAAEVRLAEAEAKMAAAEALEGMAEATVEKAAKEEKAA